MNPVRAQTTKKQPKPSNTLKTSVDAVRSHISSHPRFWLFIVFLWIQAIGITLVRNPPPWFPNFTPGVAAASKDECPSGLVYVYDLPPMFNENLVLPNCTDLDPWNYQCGITTNHGYGGPATELSRILPKNLYKSWYRTNQFALEVIFHLRILKHKCRTLEPESATAFYIPFYAGLAFGNHLWMKETSSKMDRDGKMMVRWLKKQNHWKKSNGSDHFMAIGRITWDFRRLTNTDKEWGTNLLNMPSMKKVTRLIIEEDPADQQDVSVPYPTGFHPKTIDDLNQWQDFARGYNRSSLFTFTGATRNRVKNDFRALLMDYCKKESDSCRVVDCAVAHCSADSSAAMEAFLSSEFCLQPAGDSYTRRSVFDCMLAGSVPVFFWKETAYEQYRWFLPGEPESYSVFIDHEEVRNGKSIKETLLRYNKEEIRKKRERVIETIPRIIYSMPDGGLINKGFKDAFDVAFDEVMKRIKDQKELMG